MNSILFFNWHQSITFLSELFHISSRAVPYFRQKMHSLTGIVTVALLCIVVNGQLMGLNEEDIIDCFSYCMCNPEKLPDLRKALDHYAEETMEHALGLIREYTGLTDVENTDAGWSSVSENYCLLTDKDKKDWFTNLGKGMSDCWGEVCEAGDDKQCDGISDAVDAFTKLLSELIAKGKCGGKAKPKIAVKMPTFGR